MRTAEQSRQQVEKLRAKRIADCRFKVFCRVDDAVDNGEMVVKVSIEGFENYVIGAIIAELTELGYDAFQLEVGVTMEISWL